jgi:hypothetical protein
MSGGDRKGPQGQVSKTGRCLGYCTGSNDPGYTKRVSSGAGRKLRNGAGCRQRAGCRAGQSFGRRRAFMPESLGASGTRHTHQGYYYPAPSQEQVESEAEFFEKKITLLKQELETLVGKLKTLRFQGSNGQE